MTRRLQTALQFGSTERDYAFTNRAPTGEAFESLRLRCELPGRRGDDHRRERSQRHRASDSRLRGRLPIRLRVRQFTAVPVGAGDVSAEWRDRPDGRRPCRTADRTFREQRRDPAGQRRRLRRGADERRQPVVRYRRHRRRAERTVRSGCNAARLGSALRAHAGDRRRRGGCDETDGQRRPRHQGAVGLQSGAVALCPARVSGRRPSDPRSSTASRRSGPNGARRSMSASSRHSPGDTSGYWQPGSTIGSPTRWSTSTGRCFHNWACRPMSRRPCRSAPTSTRRRSGHADWRLPPTSGPAASSCSGHTRSSTPK